MLPGTKARPERRKHRVDPDDPDRTACGRTCKGFPVAKMKNGRTPKGKPCDLCEVRMEGRKSLDRVAESDKAPAAGGSVRALRGGLPGLGRRR